MVALEPQTFGPRLTYAAESWLYRQSAEAWGDHKALLYCPSRKRREAKWATFSQESRDLINEAKKRSEE